MIKTITRTGFRTKKKKMKQNYTAMYTTCGIILDHMHILIIFKSLSFNDIFMDCIK